MRLTDYRTYTNSELLSACETKRQYSQIIEELCQRLETFNDKVRELKVECPVCEAELKVSVDSDGDVSEVETKD